MKRLCHLVESELANKVFAIAKAKFYRIKLRNQLLMTANKKTEIILSTGMAIFSINGGIIFSKKTLQ